MSIDDTDSVDWNLLKSDPPAEHDAQQTAERQKVTTEILELSKKEHSSHAQGTNSVADTIIANRRQQYTGLNSSSLLQSHEKHLAHERVKARQRRQQHLEEKSMQRRGGIEGMQQFVLNHEYKEELEKMKLQSQEYVLPPGLADSMEKEVNEDLEDIELLDYIEKREFWERELENLLDDLSLG